MNTKFLCSLSHTGHTLYLNTIDNPERPKTADTICSTTSSAGEHSLFPYENSFSTNEAQRQKSRDLKSAAPLVQGHKWKQGTTEDDGELITGFSFQEPVFSYFQVIVLKKQPTGNFGGLRVRAGGRFNSCLEIKNLFLVNHSPVY